MFKSDVIIMTKSRSATGARMFLLISLVTDRFVLFNQTSKLTLVSSMSTFLLTSTFPAAGLKRAPSTYKTQKGFTFGTLRQDSCSLDIRNTSHTILLRGVWGACLMENSVFQNPISDSGIASLGAIGQFRSKDRLVEEVDSQGESVETARESESDPETEVDLRAATIGKRNNFEKYFDDAARSWLNCARLSNEGRFCAMETSETSEIESMSGHNSNSVTTVSSSTTA
ncbi:Uncharacterized protein APZ42_031595 [Daphnia magna]|uniref:Uncharacterized protein n=1 Tax=Daphnia magna TaxID=35525 RepID=A0A162DB32_9CRUS|nr:Uncharacterized protein APZ42_031595 [Daphnia magna]